MPASSKILTARQPDRHIFDDVVNKWKEMPPDPKDVLPGYIKYKDFIKSLNHNFSEYRVYYTEAYVGENVERGFGIRIVATTKAGQNVETFYEFSTSARNGTRWKIMSDATNGLYAIKNSNLIGKIGENKFWQLLEKDRKITLSYPTVGKNVAETVELTLHKDARLMRLEYQGDGNGLDIVTKVIPANPPPEWMWLIIELKTSAVHNLDAEGFKSVSRAMSEVQKKGLIQVDKHVNDALRAYKTGNPYNLSVEDAENVADLKDALRLVDKTGENTNIAGLFITQGLDDKFEYVKNAKYTKGMRIVKEWFNGGKILK